MSFYEIILLLSAVGAMIGGVDHLMGNRFRLGQHFIEGFTALVQGDYYCVPECVCMAKDGHRGACPPGCADCHSNCNECPEDMIGKEGYNAWCNDDGVAPVTAELAEFLQKFAISQRYFADGDGWAEQRGIYAYEDSQWLFACGYYR